jgi:riboflavin kinase/FMN adenylyltransferase
MRLAGMLLGRPYSLEGRVVEGVKRGREIGFPTANIEPLKDLLPGRGVYATMLEIDGVRFESVTNIGFNPTFTDKNILSIESHVFDLDKEIYGKTVRVYFLERLRGEKKFLNVQDLIDQIGNDIARARSILKLCSLK